MCVCVRGLCIYTIIERHRRPSHHKVEGCCLSLLPNILPDLESQSPLRLLEWGPGRVTNLFSPLKLVADMESTNKRIDGVQVFQCVPPGSREHKWGGLPKFWDHKWVFARKVSGPYVAQVQINEHEENLGQVTCTNLGGDVIWEYKQMVGDGPMLAKDR